MADRQGHSDKPSDPNGTPVNSLRAGANRVAEVLRGAGYAAYFAGGCVRDGLLGVEPKDYDITTDATPDEVAALFRRTIMVGAAFGVVKVVLGKARDYEVATFRADGEYSDGRRPDGVRYSKTAKEDVERRDFTVNALLMDPETDEIIDYVDGREDLAAGRVRAVGDPAVRFAEDRLRMLRAVRFAARFGFEIEPATFAAMADNAAHLGDVSVERIAAELEGIFRSADPGHGYALMMQVGLLEPALPASRSRGEAGRRRVHEALARLPTAAAGLEPAERTIVGWALAHEGMVGKAAEAALRDLKLSREQIRGARALLEAQPVLEAMAPPDGADAVRLFASPAAKSMLAFQGCLLGPQAEPVARARALLADLAERPLPPRPLVTGADLQALGMQPGRHFKALLEAVDVEVLERRISCKDDAIAFVRAQG